MNMRTRKLRQLNRIASRLKKWLDDVMPDSEWASNPFVQAIFRVQDAHNNLCESEQVLEKLVRQAHATTKNPA
jgi:hypothetical protein